MACGPPVAHPLSRLFCFVLYCMLTYFTVCLPMPNKLSRFIFVGMSTYLCEVDCLDFYPLLAVSRYMSIFLSKLVCAVIYV